MNCSGKLAAIVGLLTLGVLAQAQELDRKYYDAVRRDDLQALRELVKTGPVDLRDRHGSTLLMRAAFAGSVQGMRMLLDAGADANAKNDFAATALMWAGGDAAKVRLLLAHGADANATSLIRRTPLMIAAFNNDGLENVKLLIQHGANVNAHDAGGDTPLHFAALASSAAMVRCLLSKRAAPDVKDVAGITPLMQAALNGNAEIVKLLLASGGNAKAVTVDVMDTVKNGPILLGRLGMLDLTAIYGGPGVTRLFINAGGSLNAADIGGVTPLLRAITTDRPNPEVIRLLLKNGADPNLRTVAGETAADWAGKSRNPEVHAALGLPAPQMQRSLHRRIESRSLSAAEAVEKSVALLQLSAGSFLKKGGCIACHSQNLTGMAVSAARSRGIRVDEASAATLTKEVVALRSSPEQQFLQLVDPQAGADGMMYSLFQMNAAGVMPNESTDAIVHYLAGSQREGRWHYPGPGRSPIEDGDFFITAFGLRSLQLYTIPSRKAEFDERIRRAAEWLARAEPISTTDRVMQLMGVHWAGGSYPATRLKELIALQQPDGGWAQTRHLSSDAYATGLVLYSLHELGVPASDPPYQRGVHYLLESEEADGSWHVRSRSPKFQPYFDSGFPQGHDQWISQAATSWAAIGLAYAVSNPAAGRP